MKFKIISSKSILFIFVSLMMLFVGIFYNNNAEETVEKANADEETTDFSEVTQMVDIEALNKNIAERETSEKLQEELLASWKVLLKDETVKYDIAIFDSHTNTLVSYSNKEIPLFYTASIAKVAVLMEVLSLEEQGIDGLSEKEKKQAKLMITESNNEVTHQFVREKLKSYTEIDRLFEKVGMHDTKANRESWGLIQTTAIDQVKLVNAIFGDQPYNRPKDVAYIKDLMSEIVPSQNWGVSKNANNTYLKNGWLSLDGMTWLVNSIGKIEDEKADYSMAILTENNDSFESGIALIESIASVTYDYLYQNTLSSN